MLAKKFRLPISEFYARKEKTETVRSAHFVVRWTQTNLPFSRFGVVVKKSEEKRAVRRNKIRRTVFDAVYLLRAHSMKGYDILMVASPALFHVSTRDVEKEIEEVLKKALSRSHI